MFIGQVLSSEACHAAQAERRSANTATAPASAATAVAATSTAAAVATERALSASPPVFALVLPAEMDSIASPPTNASADGPSPASIAGSLAGSLAPLVYAEDFYLEHNRLVRALLVLCHGLTHDLEHPCHRCICTPWLERPHPQSAGTIKSQRWVGTRKADACSLPKLFLTFFLFFVSSYEGYVPASDDLGIFRFVWRC